MKLWNEDYIYDQCPIPDVPRIFAYDRDVFVRLRCKKPQIVMLDNLMSKEECEELINRSKPRLVKSATVDPETGGNLFVDGRVGEECGFQRFEDPFIERIDRRFAAVTCSPPDFGEGLAILHYNVGGEYQPHHDYFPPEIAGSGIHLSRGGQRVATLIVYLNDVDAGGHTIFPQASKLSICPRQGSGVYFRYTNQQGQLDPLSFHGGAPVLAGEKWIVTRWIRERTFF